MSSSGTESRLESTPVLPNPSEAAGGTRIDGPHPAAGRESIANPSLLETAAAEAAPVAVAVIDRSSVAEQTRVQAAQLAEHLRARQRELDHREARLNSWAAQLESEARSARLWVSERTEELKAAADRTEADATAVEPEYSAEAEERLARELAEVQMLREDLTAARRKMDENRRAEEERFEAHRRQALAEIDAGRQAIRRRGEHVDKSMEALEQLRAELGRVHRETLEIRLATEELWAQLSGAAPPPALVQSMGRIRGRLAEHYRLANTELQEQKQEIERLRLALGEQHEQLLRQKRDFDQWAVACRQEVEKQSTRLIARGQELDHRESEFDAKQREDQAERLALRQEIRRLRAELDAGHERELVSLGRMG
jgi:hypothetical protein